MSLDQAVERSPFLQNPHVELRTGESIEEATREQLLHRRALEQVIAQALLVSRTFIVREGRERLPLLEEINPLSLDSMINNLWRLVFPRFGRLTGPYIVAAYADGFRQARAGDVSPEVLNKLADDYVMRMGTYFNDTSREALIQGFNTFVNRKLPVRVAAERALEAYGLTPRQMSGYTSNVAFDQKIESSVADQTKQKIKAYVQRSLESRFEIFATQETHNLNQQAQQVAWNWLVGNGRLPGEAEKVWITAKDERVCSICGPMHGKRVPVTEKFDNGLFVPGAHVNCRCEVKLTVVPIAKADWEENLHPRSGDGRFRNKPVAEVDRDDAMFAQFLREAERKLHEPQPEVINLPPPGISLPGARLRPISLPGTINLPQDPKPEVQTTLPTTTPITLPTTTINLPGATPINLPGVTPMDLPTVVETPTAVPEVINLPKPEEKAQVPHDEYFSTVRLDRPVYAVVDPDLGVHVNSYLDLTHETPFYPSKGEAIYEASTMRANAVADYWNDATSYGEIDPPISFYDGEYGQTLFGHIDMEDFRTVLEAVASPYDDNSTDPDPYVSLELFDSDGTFVKDASFSPYQLAEHMGIDPDDFQYGVIEMEYGHNHPKRGMTNYAPATKYGSAEISTSGPYEIMGEPELVMGDDDRNVAVYRIEPYDVYHDD